MNRRPLAPCEFSGLYDVRFCNEDGREDCVTVRAFGSADAEHKATEYVASAQSILPGGGWRVCGVTREVEGL